MSEVTPPDFPGLSGQQCSFIEKCWELATPGHSGQPRGSNAGSDSNQPLAAPAAPALPQGIRGNKTPQITGESAVLPRCPGNPHQGYDAAPRLGPDDPDGPACRAAEAHYADPFGVDLRWGRLTWHMLGPTEQQRWRGIVKEANRA
ncbi:MAG: hypothetical protein JSR77_01670 [Planctomycetes bacterium]|nr:hypothetical protein [Planctomycetota bacterium]